MILLLCKQLQFKQAVSQLPPGLAISSLLADGTFRPAFFCHVFDKHRKPGAFFPAVPWAYLGLQLEPSRPSQSVDIISAAN